jgi:limonene-1,2-epoxide hydrolase
MPSLTPGDGQDLLARLKTATERRDVDLAVSLFREDAEYRPDPFEEPSVGANAIRAVLNDDAAARANVEFDAERIWVSGGAVLSSRAGTARIPSGWTASASGVAGSLPSSWTMSCSSAGCAAGR